MTVTADKTDQLVFEVNGSDPDLGGVINGCQSPKTLWKGGQGRVSLPDLKKFLEELDPYRTERCPECGGEKKVKTVSCGKCSLKCPDPQCLGETKKKSSDKDMCSFCRSFVDNLDINKGNGESIKRDGFYVYLLENDYIGMTYHPSRRQFEHDKGSRIRRDIATDDRINDPDAYIEEEWEKVRVQHWITFPPERQRGSRIKWLSPRIESRKEAYRCEWALKRCRERDQVRYQRLLGMTSVPELEVQTVKLYYCPDKGRTSFDLSMTPVFNRLPHGLSKDQMVEPSSYEFQLRPEDDEGDSYTGVAFKQEPNLDGYSGSELFGDWRVRAVIQDVNGPDVNGPWTHVEVSRLPAGQANQQLGRVHDLQATSIGERKVRVEWAVDKPVLGITYQVYRTECGAALHEGVRERVTFCCDRSPFVDDTIVNKRTSGTYFYQVRPVLFGVRGTRENGHGGSSRCEVDRNVVLVGDRVQIDGLGLAIVQRLKGNRATVRLDTGYPWSGERAKLEHPA